LQERRPVPALKRSTSGPARGRAGIVGCVAAIVLAADQVTKTLAVSDLANGPVHLIGPFSFALAYNSGVAFSLFSGVGLPVVLLALSVIGLVIWFARGTPSVLGSVGIGLVVGGASGNLADRLFRHDGGSVIDFIHSGFWPTFNLADASVVCGCVLLVWFFLRRDPGGPNHTEDKDPV
jgi:signal peptidase II